MRHFPETIQAMRKLIALLNAELALSDAGITLPGLPADAAPYERIVERPTAPRKRGPVANGEPRKRSRKRAEPSERRQSKKSALYDLVTRSGVAGLTRQDAIEQMQRTFDAITPGTVSAMLSNLAAAGKISANSDKHWRVV